MASEALKHSAVSNALSPIRRDRRFPFKVYVRDWKDYLFFEPHTMFGVSFIEVTGLLLREEESSVIAMINLGNDGKISDKDLRAIFLEQDTGPMEYVSELKGDGSAMNWLFLMDRYICASDKGQWSIYCEKENDIAVLAISEEFSTSTCSQVEKLLMAKSIKSRFSSKKSHAFDFDELVPEWKSTLMAEYAS